MLLKIQILCPGNGCKKCKRMISFIKETINELKLETEIEVVNDIEQMQDFQTWILPSIFINNEIVSRGYLPTKKYFITKINTLINK
jgi:hypothetical protein